MTERDWGREKRKKETEKERLRDNDDNKRW